MEYVYSLYAHLSQFGALVNVNQNVVAGQLIGQVDDTGYSSGNHLHLQIMIDSNANRTITYPLSWSEAKSRNPELWLNPYPNTGTVVGKVTNTSGNPVGGVLVYGLQKQAAWGYAFSQTYSDAALNPDDILVENWATTDVTPGTYEITLSTGYSFGQHTVQAGRITYVGLFPVWLPDVRNGFGWSGQIIVRNNSSTYQAQVNTTYFYADGSVLSQRTDYINANATVTFTPPSSFWGSAIVVSSEDVSVVVVNDSGSKANAYEGIPAPPSVSGLGTGTSVYVPAHFINYYGWSSTVYVQNAGTALTTISAYLYQDSGAQVGSYTTSLSPNGSTSFSLTGVISGSVRVTASQPLAVLVRHDLDLPGADSMEYPGVVSGGTVGYVPALFREYYGWTSSYQSQAVTSNNLSVTYYPGGAGPTFALNTWGHREVWLGNETQLGTLWHGAAKVSVTSGGPVVTAAHHSTATGAIGYLGYKAGARDLYLPTVKNVSGWNASVTVQNVGTANASVTVRFYNASGVQTGSYGPFTVTAGSSRELYSELPTGFNGSVWVHSDGADVVAAVHQSVVNGRAYGYGAVP